MNTKAAKKVFDLVLISFLCLCGFSQFSVAQGPAPDAPLPAIEPSSFVSATSPEVQVQHRFWDRQNLAFISANAALSTVDFFVTRANLQSGGRELNPIVRIFGRSTPGLALNFGGETAGIIALGYYLHRSRHHRLERIAFTLNFGASAGAVSYGLAHR